MSGKYSLFTVITACALCCVLTVGVIFVCILFSVGGWDALRQAGKYASVAEIIDTSYIGDSDPESVCDAAISGMIDSLGDRWSYYMTAEEYDAYKLRVNNVYTGVGITVVQDEQMRGMSIASVYEGSPAEEAGIVAGDLLLAVDGQTLAGMSSSDAKTLIQSRNGQEMLFRLEHTDGTQSEVRLSSGEIKINPVEYEMLDNKIGYVRILNFEVGSADAASAATAELLDMGAEAVIFDVRSNPGGRVSELTDLLDYLLPEGDIFVSVNESGTESVTVSDADCIVCPMAVLVNENSYSAAELFAATLREYGYADIVGAPTTGKGRSQITISLSDGSAVHLSTNKYLTPQRVDLSEAGGLVPDHVVENSADADVQLAMATKILS